jgi:hypothetical protein
VGLDLGGHDATHLLAALHRRTAAQSGPAGLEERQHLADELATLAEAAGDDGFAVLAAHHQAMAAAEMGEEAVVDKAVAVLEVAARRGDRFATAMLAERAVATSVVEGRLADAHAALDAAVDAVATALGTTGRTADDPGHGPPTQRRSALAATMRPDARALLDPPATVAARHRVVLDWLAGVDPPAGVLLEPLPDGIERLHALAVHALAASAAGRPTSVAEVRAALAPYADRTCGVGYRCFAGAASFHLGRLAAAAGDWSDAERHLQAALRHHTLLGARPWVALTQRALAGAVEARGRASDREWIAGLRSEADHVTSSLGLRAD